jgi:hypothetical protein
MKILDTVSESEIAELYGSRVNFLREIEKMYYSEAPSHLLAKSIIHEKINSVCGEGGVHVNQILGD